MKSKEMKLTAKNKYLPFILLDELFSSISFDYENFVKCSNFTLDVRRRSKVNNQLPT